MLRLLTVSFQATSTNSTLTKVIVWCALRFAAIKTTQSRAFVGMQLGCPVSTFYPKASFAMNFAVIDAELVVKLLLLLLIGMGPKVALVPFLEKTKHLDVETQRAVGRRMVVTAVVTAIVLFATGWLLLRLLHISGGAVAVGVAIVLAILAVNMAAVPTKKVEEVVEIREDPKQIAVYPLAVPYLLNPAGITILIIASSEIVSVASATLVLGLVLLVGAVDYW